MDLYTHAKSFNLGFNQLLGAYDLLNLMESNKEERKDRERWYQSSLDYLRNHPFEAELKKHAAYKLYLKNIQRLVIHKTFQQSDDADVLRNICSLKIVSAALQAFDDPTGQYSSTPLANRRKSLDSKVGRNHIPTEQTANTARRLINYLKAADAELGWMDDLKAISNREPYPQLKVNSKVKAVIKDITVWSQQLFDSPKSPKGRFPISAIRNIFEIVESVESVEIGELDVSDEAIRKHQVEFSTYKNISVSIF